MRVQVNISDEMVGRVDEYARKMGVSRSALCSVIVCQGIMGYERSNELLKLIGDKVGDFLIEGKKLEGVKEICKNGCSWEKGSKECLESGCPVAR